MTTFSLVSTPENLFYFKSKESYKRFSAAKRNGENRRWWERCRDLIRVNRTQKKIWEDKDVAICSRPPSKEFWGARRIALMSPTFNANFRHRKAIGAFALLIGFPHFPSQTPNDQIITTSNEKNTHTHANPQSWTKKMMSRCLLTPPIIAQRWWLQRRMPYWGLYMKSPFWFGLIWPISWLRWVRNENGLNVYGGPFGSLADNDRFKLSHPNLTRIRYNKISEITHF